jgi:amino acid transporter
MTNPGVVISFVIVFGGLLAIFIYSLRGKDIDRRVIFLFVFVSVASAVLFNIQFKEYPTPIVKKVFDKIESLPPGSKVLISFDYDPAMKPEVHPMANAFVRHCMVRGLKLYLMTLWATGQALMTETVEQVLKPEFPNAVYGKDYVTLGFKAGGSGVLNVIITDFRKMYPTDENNVSLDSIPMFAEVKSAKDLDLILPIGGGQPGPKEWILFIGDPGHVPVAPGLAAVVAPLIYPYYPKQALGLLGGVKGAAEYESELRHKYPQFDKVPAPALRMMGPQTMAHIVIMAFIVIGNITYFRSRRRGPDNA